MEFKKYTNNIKYIYHYTKKENISTILNEKQIKCFNDKYTFFTTSIDDSYILFNELMMKRINYINNNLNVCKRDIEDPNDYAILKIKVNNDNKFYNFICNTNGFNPYNYSILHKGNLTFDNIEILDMNNKKEQFDYNPTNFFTKLLKGYKKTIITATTLGILMFGSMRSVDADSWLENNHYDISWYNDSQNNFVISNPEQMAGLSYLVNEQNCTFTNKIINFNNDIDLTDNTWVTISNTFNGLIEGAHRLFITVDDSSTEFIANQSLLRDVISIEKHFNIDISSNMNGGDLTINSDNPKESDQIEFELQIKNGYLLDNISLVDKDNNQVSFTNMGNNIYKFTMPNKKISLTVTYNRIEYKFIKDKKIEYNNKNLVFKLNKNIFSINKLYLNNKLISSSNYEVINNSIVLKNTMLKNLKPGTYKLKAKFTNDYEDQINFIVNEDNPNTYDNISFYFLISILSLFGILTITKLKRKINNCL